jgi:uncharacterized protein
MMIDVHTHAFPDEVAPKAVAAIETGAPDGFYAAGDGTLDGLAQSMRQSNIDVSVVLPVATKPAQLVTINRWAAEKHAPENGIVFFGGVHPEDPEWENTIETICDAGLPGVKMHSEFQRFALDTTEMIPRYKMLAEAGLIVLFHMGDELFVPCEKRATPAMLAHLLEKVPDLRVIAAHGGAFRQWSDFIDRVAGHPRVWIDTAFLPGYISQDTWEKVIEAHGIDRVLFGSDYPWMSQEKVSEFIKSSACSSEELEKISVTNAAALLEIEM